MCKKLCDLAELVGAGAGGERVEELASVGFAPEAGVQNRDHATVGGGTEQATKALLEA